MPEDLLRAALTERADPWRARLALKTLSRRLPAFARAEARSLLRNREALEELRSTAAIELGRYRDADSEEVLVGALRDARPGLLKHVAKSLGQIGGPEALASLEQVSVSEDSPASAALRFAKTLIAYRLGSSAYLLNPAVANLGLTPGTTDRTNLEFNELSDNEFEAALPSIRRQLPTLPVNRKSGLRFLCGNSEHWILLHETVTGPSAANVIRRQPMVVGAILKYRACSDQYSLDEYLFTNGGGEDSVVMVGVRPSGIIVHAGVVKVSEGSVRFEVRSSNPPYARPMDLRGHFEAVDGRLAFSRALIGTLRHAPQVSVPTRRMPT
jgi:hypothetical protein